MLISLVYCIPFGLFLSGLAAMLHWFDQPVNTMHLTSQELRDARTGLGGATVSTTHFVGQALSDWQSVAQPQPQPQTMVTTTTTDTTTTG